MFSTDQTHLRRYFATLGVAIAAGTLSLAGLFLKLQQDLLVTQPTLKQLTPSARDALLRRQDYLSFGTAILPWFVLTGFVGGAALASYGLLGWARRQRVIDEREDIGLRREQVELRQLTDTEKVDKLDRDAKESANGAAAPSARKAAAFDNVRTEIAIIENALVGKLREIYRPSDVLSSVGMRSPEGRRFEVDVVVRAGLPDAIVFELKYAATPNNISNRIVDGLNQVVRAASYANARAVLIIVVSDAISSTRLEQARAQALSLASGYRSVISVYVDTYSNFLTLTAEDFAIRLGLVNPSN
jgi:hypothetical protein